METKFDLVIIGGGAAGIIAAISAKRQFPQRKICLIDRTFTLGRKILVSGAGRCNITNINLDRDYKSRYYGADPQFIEQVFTKFGYQQIMDFFHELGIETYVERKTSIGKVFPITDSAKNVVAILEDELHLLDIQIRLNTEVTGIKKTNTTFTVTTNNGVFESQKLIVATGGMTYPALGANGSSYSLLKKLGHTIQEPVPAALPLTAKDPLCHELQGVKLEAQVTSIIDGKAIKTKTDDVMFAQYGLSGPAILNVSREISLHCNREKQGGTEIAINFFPNKSLQEATTYMTKIWQARPLKTIEKSFWGLFPAKVSAAILKTINIPIDKSVKDLSENEKQSIMKRFVEYKIKISGTRGWNEAEFTAGGVETNEVNAATLESKIVPGLYFCGEILNVDGDIGGFNLSWAWSSGWIAGSN
jgi:predicted Rossmann fold flavoprotein